MRSKDKKRSEDDEEPRLGSVFLCWFLDEEEELSELGYDELRVPFVNEIVRFTQLEKVSRILRERHFSAFSPMSASVKRTAILKVARRSATGGLKS